MRQIKPKMVAFIDSKLVGNGAAQHAIAVKDARSLMIYAAEACVGIREATNNNDGPMVELIQSTVGDASGEAWCMAFVQTCIAYAELKTGVKSPLMATEHCLTLWRNTPEGQRVKMIPAPGAIIIWQHGTSDRGHTGFMTEWLKPLMETVEGNTTSGVRTDGSIEREGGGVYINKRNVIQNGLMRVVGFIKPF